MNVLYETCRKMAHDGYGWEDVLVVLREKGLADTLDQGAVRRFVLAVSVYTRRYGT